MDEKTTTRLITGLGALVGSFFLLLFTVLYSLYLGFILSNIYSIFLVEKGFPEITLFQAAAISLVYKVMSFRSLKELVFEDGENVTITGSILYDIFVPILFFYAALIIKYLSLIFE